MTFATNCIINVSPYYRCIFRRAMGLQSDCGYNIRRRDKIFPRRAIPNRCTQARTHAMAVSPWPPDNAHVSKQEQPLRTTMVPGGANGFTHQRPCNWGYDGNRTGLEVRFVLSHDVVFLHAPIVAP